MQKQKHSRELAIIKQNIDKLKNDMVNFLDTEKLERNQVFYNHEQICNLSKLVLEKNLLFRETTMQKRITLDWKIDDALYLKADPVAIDRILNNLLDNAVKYTNKKGSIHVNLTRDGETIKLTISDTGIGIAEEQQAVIFAPFYQLSHKKRNIQGLGMGLSITKSIMESLQSNITVNSQPGKGSEFVLVFPYYEKPHNEAVIPDVELLKPADPIIPDQKALITKRYDPKKNIIFLVEDNLPLIAGMKQELENQYNVCYATNGQEAFEKLQTI